MTINLNMRARLVAAFVVVALVPMILLALLNNRSTQEALERDAEQALFAVASQTADSLDGFIATNLNSITTEAQLPVLVDYLNLPAEQRPNSLEKDDVLALFRTLESKESHITSYALLDRNGINLIDTFMDDVGQDKSDREYFTFFQQEPAPEQPSFVSHVVFSPITGEPSLYFSSPVKDRLGNMLGLLRVRYHADILQSLLEEKNDLAGPGSFGILFDEVHLHLAHGIDPAVNFLPIVRLDPELTAELRAARRLPDLTDEALFILQLDDLEEHLSNPETQRFFEAEDVATGDLINQVAIAQMETQPWLITFLQPQEIFLEPVVNQSSNTLQLAVVIAGAAIFAAFIMAQTLGRPIVQLSETVSQFTAGNLQARAEVRSNDETGLLARSFNKMAIQVGNLLTGLEERTDELESEIAVRKEVEDALRESEERYRSISDLTSDYIYSVTVTEEGTLVLDWATDAFSRLTGYTPAELSAYGGWPKLVHPDDRHYFEQGQQNMLASGQPDMAEYRIITKSDETRWLRDFRRPQWDETAGRVTRLLGAAQDITIHKQADEEREHLLAELARLTTVIETTSDFVALITLEGRILYVNPAGMTMIGRDGVDYRTVSIADFRPAETIHLLQDEIFQVVREQGVWAGELPMKHADGHTIPTSQVITLIRSENGDPVGMGTIARDISQSKQVQYELKKAKEAAEAANRSKSAFLANMSHELRTPLNAILGFTQLMSHAPNLETEQREHLHIINRSGEHLLALINDILEVSKIEAGRTTLSENSFDLHQMLADMENMFRLRANDKGLKLTSLRGQDIPQFIKADEGKLRQILINLLGNAIKFTLQGTVALRTRLHQNGGQLRLRFEVEDTGPGISPDELEHLFEAFIQTKTGQQAQEGTGLGLPISQQFVQMMGGEISVTSRLNQGSTFYFDIPFEAGAADQIESRQPARGIVGLAPGQSPYRILIVEDQPENRVLLSKLLQRVGFTVREAVNGREAIEQWQSWSPHLIWMDMQMPIMDGYEATRQIKATAQGQATTIIALTASAFEEDRATILAAGCDDFVRKPFQEEEIFEKMALYLGAGYIYEEAAGPQKNDAAASRPDPLRPEALSAIPTRLFAELHQAVIEADIETMDAIIEQIGRQDEQVAAAFSSLARNFQYDKITELIQSKL